MTQCAEISAGSLEFDLFHFTQDNCWDKGKGWSGVWRGKACSLKTV